MTFHSVLESVLFKRTMSVWGLRTGLGIEIYITQTQQIMESNHTLGQRKSFECTINKQGI